MNILVVNCGSSSVKLQLIHVGGGGAGEPDDRLLARGAVERIGTADAIVTYSAPGAHVVQREQPVGDHTEALRVAIGGMLETYAAVQSQAVRIDGIGHRVVHGGEHFSDAVRIDPEVEQIIEEMADLAPLHNPHNLRGYHAARALFPDVPQVAVFDTGFHRTMPPRAFLYALPHAMYSRYKVRKYGFHGTSHRYVAQRFAEIRQRPLEEFKLITCHLGNGCSMAAIDRGRSVDTSMGFTPLEGLVMGTRAGDIDCAAVFHVMAKENLSQEEALALVNYQSGLLGLSETTNDVRELLSESAKGNERATLALDVFCYRVKKYIGAYFAALNGADAVIFTGGIGERATSLRAAICGSMDALGIALDDAKNSGAAGVEAEISAPASRTRVWVIPTNEELLIARETARVIRSGG
jgi:acetate kinase